jgi:hypothetical protein
MYVFMLNELHLENQLNIQESPSLSDNIENWPKNIEITSKSGSTTISNDMYKLISENRWDLRITDQETGVLSLEILPKKTEYSEYSPGSQEYFDPTIASVGGNGEILLKPDSEFTLKFPLEQQKGTMYRGVSAGELWDILEKGAIKSKSEAVENIKGHEGATFFATTLFEGKGYAEKPGRFPCAWNPAFGEATYLLAVPIPKDQKEFLEENPTIGEVAMREPISIEDLSNVIEIRPLKIKAGTVPLYVNDNVAHPPNNYIAMLRNGPEFTYCYRSIPISTVLQKRSLINTEKNKVTS